MTRRSLFGSTAGYEPQLRAADQRVHIFSPTRGLHSGLPAQALPPGFTPESRNFVPEGGFIRPRSGLSQFGSTPFAGPVLGIKEIYDINGLLHLAGASTHTLAWYNSVAASWITLSPVTGSLNPAGTIDAYWQIDQTYDAAVDQHLISLTNGLNTPKYFYPHASTTTFSDFTSVYSLFSTAKAVVAFDNRLIWGNLTQSDTATRLPQRVLWSARGNPHGYAIGLDGSGFEDLMELKGEILAIIPEGDGLVIFTAEEIWRARRRGDAYAFDFAVSLRQMGGLFHRTVAAVPGGLIFLGRDMELYVLSGHNVQPIGPNPRAGEESRVQTHLRVHLISPERAFGIYNVIERRYELYYTDAASLSRFPNRALYLHFENGAFFEQRFDGQELSAGVDFEDTGVSVTWDQVEQTWDSYDFTWDNVGSGGTLRIPTFFSDVGTPFRMLPNHPDDAGIPIDARWRSHGLSSGNQLNYDQLYEVWLEYSSPSNSSVSVFTSPDLGQSFRPDFALSLPASGLSTAVAPLYLTASAPQFEIRLNDGSRPRIGRMQASVRDGGSWGGGR
jgi:hypothetical protein